MSGWWVGSEREDEIPCFTLFLYFVTKVENDFPVLAGQILVRSFGYICDVGWVPGSVVKLIAGVVITHRQYHRKGWSGRL